MGYRKGIYYILFLFLFFAEEKVVCISWDITEFVFSHPKFIFYFNLSLQDTFLIIITIIIIKKSNSFTSYLKALFVLSI